MGYAQTRGQRFHCSIKCLAEAAAIFLIASVCAGQATPPPQQSQVPWLQELDKYPGLYNEFGKLIEKLQHNIQFPPARSESRILPLLPEATLSYAAFPNYGEVAREMLQTFRQELQVSPVLQDWLKHEDKAKVEAKIEEGLEKFDQLSQYLGDEIVVSGAKEGKDPSLLVVAEIRKAGFKDYLQQMVKELAGKSEPTVRVLDSKELDAAEDHPGQDLVVLVRPDFVVAALDVATLRSFSKRVEAHNREFVSTPFARRIEQEYEGGVTVLAAADMQKIVALVPPGSKEDQAVFQNTGFTDMKYLVWDHKRVAGQAVSQTELSFTGPRHGAASWLAAPAQLGSLDYVSPKAMLVTSVVLAKPGKIFDDVKELAGSSGASTFATLATFEQALNLSLKEDLLKRLGGEITLELDGITPPAPAWKAILQVNDAGHVQQTIQTLLTTAHMEAVKVDDGGVTYYTVRIPAATNPMEIGYSFVDGYLVIGSSREAVEEGVRLHASGESLGKSKKFLASLPPGHPAGVSGLLYEDPIAMAVLQLRQVAPERAGMFEQLTGKSAPAVMCAYGEETAIREVSTNPAFDAGAVLVAAAIAIPNLLRSRNAAYEGSAAASIRTVNVAQVMYSATYPERGYAPDLRTLGPDPRGPRAGTDDYASLIEANLAGPSCTARTWCTKSGFRFSVAGLCAKKLCKEYVVVGTPVETGTGGRSFCSTSDGVIRFKIGSPMDTPVSVPECREWQPLE